MLQPTIRRALPLACLAALAAACSDPVAPVAPPQRASAQLQAPQPARGAWRDGNSRWSPEITGEVDSIARVLASALADPRRRGDLARALRASTGDDEHKLTLRGVVAASTSGPAAGLAAGEAPDPRRDRVRSALDDLEAYFPVRAHRDAYDGGAELLVAYEVEEGEAPVAYTAKGERIQLSAIEAPATPVLMITSREGAIRKGAIAASCRNVARSADAIGTWECGPAQARGGARPAPGARGVPAPGADGDATAQYDDCVPHPWDPPCPEPPQTYYWPAGIYISSGWLLNLHEPWPRGDPEIIIHASMDPILGRTYPERIAAVGPSPFPTSAQYHHQGGNSFSRQIGYMYSPPTGLLFSEEMLRDIQALQPTELEIEVWEDDQGSQHTLDVDNAFNLIRQSAEAARSLYGSARSLGGCDESLGALEGAIGVVVAVKAFSAVLKACAVWKTFNLARSFVQTFGGDDDYIGVVTPLDAPSWAEPMTHVIIGPTGMNVGHFNFQERNAP